MDTEPAGHRLPKTVGEPGHGHSLRAQDGRSQEDRGADGAHASGSAKLKLGADDDLQGGVDIFTGDSHLRSLADIEADIIRLAIGHYRGRMSEAARRLGIGRSTLYRKLAELGIDPRN